MLKERKRKKNKLKCIEQELKVFLLYKLLAGPDKQTTSMSNQKGSE